MGVSESSQLVFPVDGAMQKTWDDAVARWLIEKADKASLKSDQCIIRWLNLYLLGMPLQNINRAVVDHLLLQKSQSGSANGTINRMLALLRSILRRASLEWEWCSSIPRVRLLREPTRRVRYVTHVEAQRLLSELPSHLAAMAAFSLATGLRKSNVTGLQWNQVDLPRCMAWVHPDQSKSRKAIPVPLNDDAIRILLLQVGRHSKFVLALNGEAVGQVSTNAWKKALERAGIENFRWHDLRHTWASWHVQNGTHLNVLQEFGGGKVLRWCGGMHISQPHILLHMLQNCHLLRFFEGDSLFFDA